MIFLKELNKYHYRSIIKKHPLGLGNRMQRFDQWTKTWNDPNIKSYYDYFYNGEVGKYQMFIPDCEKSKAEVNACGSRFRPKIFEFHNKLMLDQPEYGDDKLMSVDINSKSLKLFAQECFDKQRRTDIHRLFMWFWVALGLLVITFYRGVFIADYSQSQVQLQPDDHFYHYNMNMIQKEVNLYISKINIINKHSLEVFQQAKNKAAKRIRTK